LICITIDDFIVCDAHGRELGFGGYGTATGRPKAGDGVRRVFENDGMADTDVLERASGVVEEGRVYLFEDVEAFDDFAEDGGFAVELGGEVVAEGDQELGGREFDVGVVGGGRAGHGDCAALEVVELGAEFGFECA